MQLGKWDKNAAKETVKVIGTLFDRDNQQWNDNLKACMVRMAKAYAGRMLEMSDESIIKNVYYSMNNIIGDFNGVEAEQMVRRVTEKIQYIKEELSTHSVRSGIVYVE